jgi:hypothetical protein
MWLDLENVKTGQINLSLTLLPIEGDVKPNPGTLKLTILSSFGVHGSDECEYLCRAKVGGTCQMTAPKSINSLDWNQSFSLPIAYPDKETLQLTIQSDDEHETVVGEASIPMKDVVTKDKEEDCWIKLDKTENGTIHLLMNFVKAPSVDEIVATQSAKALLQLYLGEAKNLPGSAEYIVTFKLGTQKQRSRPLKNPSAGWKENLHFDVDDITVQKMRITIIEKKKMMVDKKIAVGTFPLDTFNNDKLNDIWVKLEHTTSHVQVPHHLLHHKPTDPVEIHLQCSLQKI